MASRIRAGLKGDCPEQLVMEDKRNHSPIHIAFIGLLLLLIAEWPASSARADWGEAGAQVGCNKETMSFEVLPFDRSSDDPPEGISLKHGFKEVISGHLSITCKLGTHTLNAEIEVYPPAARGACMGSGFVRARSISVSGVELLPDGPAFNWTCLGGDASLVRILVTISSNDLVIERCYADDGTSAIEQTHKAHCDSKELKIDDLASKQASLVHSLADAKTQAALAPSNLPADNDLAAVLGPSDGGQHSIPICAHLGFISAFIRTDNSIVGDKATIPHGRIAGTIGDRVHIHAANPQVCNSASEPICKSTTYLIPGDLVDVGFICGQWTYIRYPPKTNASQPVYGWVETNRLYAVDSLITPHPNLWAASQHAIVRNSPLALAVADDDLPTVDRLTSLDATHPSLENVSALQTAISAQNLRVVTLLAPRTNIKKSCGALIDNAVFATQSILDVLTRAGLDFTCDKNALIRVSGADRISDLNFRLSTWGVWAPMRELPGRVQQLISSGIPVDWPEPAGKTALLATIQPNNVDVARVLLKAGADPNISSTDAPSGATALQQAISNYGNYLDPTMVQLLLDGGADPNHRTEGNYHYDKDSMWNDTLAGVTPLNMTAEAGYLTLTKILLDHGADPRIARSDGVLPAGIARQNGHPEVAALIEDYLRRK
jgi:hypothetical protein